MKARSQLWRYPLLLGTGSKSCAEGALGRAWMAAAQEATASCASPANTRCSTQRYSRERQPSVRCTGGYQAARASGALSRCEHSPEPPSAA